MQIAVINKVNESLSGQTGTAFRNNALDTISTTYTLELDARLTLSTQVQVVKVGNTFTLTNGNWADLIAAFDGAAIDFNLNKTTPSNSTTSTTVITVNGADMTLANGGGYADGDYKIGWFQITSSPEQFDFFVNLVTNSVATGTNSLIDSEAIRFSVIMVNSLTELGGTDEFVQLGNKSGGSQFTTKTISRLTDDATTGNKQYEIIVVYKNWLCVDSTPYFSSEAVGDYYKFQAFMLNGDPSVLVQGENFQVGNTGFKDESFNGHPSDYQFVSIVWTDNSANVMDSFAFDEESNFSIEITGTGLNLADVFNFKMFTLPNDSTEYQVKPNPIENNLTLAVNPTLIPNATPTNITGNLDDSGAGYDITGLNFAVTAGVNVIITGKVVPNAAFTTLFASRDINDRAYKLWIQCEDSTATFKNLNTVNVVADETQSKENIQPLGKWNDLVTLEMQDHNSDVYILTPDPYLEDDALINVEFTLPKDTVDNPWLSIRMRMVAYRNVDEESFILEESIYDTSGLPTNTTTGILPLDYTENRGFKLPATSDKHDITVQLFPSLDTGSDFGVQVLYPFIVRYEDWLPLPQANDDFYNFKTKNWFPYSNHTDWQVQFEIGLEVAAGEYVNTLIYTIHDYDDWGEVPGSSLAFQQLDLTSVTKPFKDESTLVTGNHELAADTWNGNEWAVTRVRPENGAPQYIISTVLDRSDVNNPNLPVSGETKGKLTVGPQLLTIESAFDPFKDIDTSGNLTFVTRVSGSTTGGQRGNVYKQTYTPARNPVSTDLRPRNDDEEDRGYKGCCDPTLVIADETNAKRNNNDIAKPEAFGDSVTFNLTKDGVTTTYVPTAIQYPNQPDAWYAQIEWRDVLISDGEGCYSIDMVPVVAGNAHASINYGTYKLRPYNKDGYLHAKYTARILSQFNDVDDFTGINRTDSFALESLRIFNGKFGYFDPKTEVDKVEYLDGRNEKVKTEDFTEYELRVSGITQCIATPLLSHLRGMTNCWMSSYNYDDFDYADLSMKNVILLEGFTPEHIDGSRMINGTVRFQDKIFNKRAHFLDNRQTAESAEPPAVCTSNTVFSTHAFLLKTGQTISYRTGDDGDLQNGRGLDILTLPSNNPFGNTFRFTDEFGGQTFASGVVIDWTQESPDGTQVVGYNKNIIAVGMASWNAADDNSLALSLGTFTTGWFLANRREGFILVHDGVGSIVLDYPPFNISTNINIWLSTTRSDGAAAGLILVSLYGQTNVTQNKANSHYYLSARIFTVTGTTLT